MATTLSPITITIRGYVTPVDLSRGLRDGVVDLLDGWSDVSFRSSQDHVPVEFGALKDSGAQDAPSELTRHVTYEASNSSGHNYGFYQEYGTRFHGAQPFLTPGFWEGVEWVEGHAQEVIERQFGGG